MVFLAVVLPISGQQQSAKPDGNQANRKEGANPASPPSRVVTCEVQEDGTTIKCRWPDNVPDSYLKRLFSPENAPNIALFFVGVGGIVVAVITLRKIERQTNLQAIAYTQWIVVKNWRSELMDEVNPMRLEDGTPLKRLRIRLEIVNESQFPLTIIDSVIAFKGRRSDDIGTLRFYPPANFPLFPNVPYLVDVSIVLNKEETATFETGIMFVRIEGSFIYKGVLIKTEHYPLYGMLWCGKAGTRFDAEIPNRPEETKADKRGPKAN